MNKNVIRCRCGHRVLGREVLRTEFYERRAPASDPFLGESVREYVYVKFRCKRCKRMGENFIPDHRWDWKMLEPDRNELNDVERDFFLDEEPLSTEDIVDLHNQLESASSFDDLKATISTGELKNESMGAKEECSTSVNLTSSTRSVRSNEPRPSEPRANERQNDARLGDARTNDSTTPKPPIPPIASDDSSRK